MLLSPYCQKHMANINLDPSLRPTLADIVSHEAEQFTPIVKATSQLSIAELLAIAKNTGAETQVSQVHPTIHFFVYPSPKSPYRFFFGIDPDDEKPLSKRVLRSNHHAFDDLSRTAAVIRQKTIEFVQPFLLQDQATIASLTVGQLTYPGQRPRYRNEPLSYQGFDRSTLDAYEIANRLATITRR